MQSILLISGNKENSQKYINGLSIKQNVDSIDVSVNSFEKILGIDDVRDMQKKVFLKPFRSKTKIIVIEAMEGITSESQNALLKLLEEPPNNTTIIVVAPSIGQILPTILSRCKIIKLKEDNPEEYNKETPLYFDILTSFLKGDPGERLKMAQDIVKNNGNALVWIEKMIVVTRTKLLENYSDTKYAFLLRSLQETHDVIKNTNVAPRIALENFFLSF